MYFLPKDSGGNWGIPEPILGEVNGPYHDGPATFNKEGNEMYFTRNNYISTKHKKNDDNINTLKIFKATEVDGIWKNIQEIYSINNIEKLWYPSNNIIRKLRKD